MKKIFITEDETITSLFIEKTLVKNNFIMCGKTDRGDLAYEKIIETKPDLILLDLKLKSNVTGFDIIEKMIENNINIPIVLITGNSDLSTISALKEKGMTHFLFKPFSQEDLIEKINEVFSKKML